MLYIILRANPLHILAFWLMSIKLRRAEFIPNANDKEIPTWLLSRGNFLTAIFAAVRSQNYLENEFKTYSIPYLSDTGQTLLVRKFNHLVVNFYKVRVAYFGQKFDYFARHINLDYLFAFAVDVTRWIVDKDDLEVDVRIIDVEKKVRTNAIESVISMVEGTEVCSTVCDTKTRLYQKTNPNTQVSEDPKYYGILEIIIMSIDVVVNLPSGVVGW